MDVDELYSVRNNFFVGAFKTAVEEGAVVPPLSQQKEIDCKAYVYRSRLELGEADAVISEINEGPMALEAVKYLATFQSRPAEREAVMEKVTESLADELTSANPTLRLVAGLIYTQRKEYTDALTVLHGPGADAPEHAALSINVLLKMNRLDVAQRELAELTESGDDDAVITQLAQAWVYSSMNGAKVEEASYIFQELMDKFEPTPDLLNSLAVCKIKMGQFPEAEELLTSALEENPEHIDSLVNSVVCSRHQAKPEEHVKSLMETIKKLDPGNEFIKSWEEATKSFDDAAASYAES